MLGLKRGGSLWLQILAEKSKSSLNQTCVSDIHMCSEMMFCTTFLSAPTDEILDGASDLGGCLAPLQCLVLPQDELYGSFSDPAANLRHSECTCVVMGKILLNLGLGGGDISGRCSPSFLLSPAYGVEREDAGRSWPEMLHIVSWKTFKWLDEVLYWPV